MATSPADSLFPGQARLALALIVVLPDAETPGAASDYAFDIGLPRILKLCADHQFRASVAATAEAADERPDLLAQLCARGHELVARCAADDLPALLDQLRAIEGAVVHGWQALDAADDEHADPAEILAAGCSFRLREARTELTVQELCGLGALTEVPLAPDLVDAEWAPSQASDAWLQHLIDSFDTLHDEATAADPLMMAITLHPQVIGRPGRIKVLEQFLAYVTQQDGVWCAPAGAIALAGTAPAGEG